MDEPSSGMRRVAFKIRSKGPGWIVRRLAAEASQPTTPPGRLLHGLARNATTLAAALPRRLHAMAVPKPEDAVRTLFAFYDLQVSPITFDFLWFLVGADLERRRRGLEAVHVVIVPGRAGGLRREREDYEGVVDAGARTQRISNILLPACALLPTCAGVTHAASRRHAGFIRSTLATHLYPAHYEPAVPVFAGSRECLANAGPDMQRVPSLRATEEGLRNVDLWAASHADGRRIVTITLRNYAYMPARNSNMEAWTAFARSLDSRRFMPVFIPDLEQTLNGQLRALQDYTVLGEAAWNLGLRMALYERSYISLGVNTGPMGLCWLNARTHYATLKMAPENVPQTSRAFYLELGFELERSLPFAAPTQELVWEDDTLAAIQRAFARIAERIESGARAPECSSVTARDAPLDNAPRTP
jgi:hypothetical protein